MRMEGTMGESEKTKRRPRSEAERLDEMIATLKAIGAKAYMAPDEEKADACKAAVASLQHVRAFK